MFVGAVVRRNEFAKPVPNLQVGVVLFTLYRRDVRLTGDQLSSYMIVLILNKTHPVFASLVTEQCHFNLREETGHRNTSLTVVYIDDAFKEYFVLCIDILQLLDTFVPKRLRMVLLIGERVNAGASTLLSYFDKFFQMDLLIPI